jgi:hypothetical protein
MVGHHRLSRAEPPHDFNRKLLQAQGSVLRRCLPGLFAFAHTSLDQWSAVFSAVSGHATQVCSS